MLPFPPIICFAWIRSGLFAVGGYHEILCRQTTSPVPRSRTRTIQLGWVWTSPSMIDTPSAGLQLVAPGRGPLEPGSSERLNVALCGSGSVPFLIRRELAFVGRPFVDVAYIAGHTPQPTAFDVCPCLPYVPVRQWSFLLATPVLAPPPHCIGKCREGCAPAGRRGCPASLEILPRSRLSSVLMGLILRSAGNTIADIHLFNAFVVSAFLLGILSHQIRVQSSTEIIALCLLPRRGCFIGLVRSTNTRPSRCVALLSIVVRVIFEAFLAGPSFAS